MTRLRTEIRNLDLAEQALAAFGIQTQRGGMLRHYSGQREQAALTLTASADSPYNLALVETKDAEGRVAYEVAGDMWGVAATPKGREMLKLLGYGNAEGRYYTPGTHQPIGTPYRLIQEYTARAVALVSDFQGRQVERIEQSDGGVLFRVTGGDLGAQVVNVNANRDGTVVISVDCGSGEMCYRATEVLESVLGAVVARNENLQHNWAHTRQSDGTLIHS